MKSLIDTHHHLWDTSKTHYPWMTDELDAIRRRFAAGLPGAPVIGALTLGEISSVGDRYLEFLNKTCVVAALGDREPA